MWCATVESICVDGRDAAAEYSLLRVLPGATEDHDDRDGRRCRRVTATLPPRNALMLWVLAVLVLGACDDRKPGLSECIDYKRENGKVSCRAACYLVTKPDGGTTGYTVKTSGMSDEATCKLELQRQATHGCKP